MGIQYRRDEMTLSALARDTARMGALLSKELQTGVTIEETPHLAPLPGSAQPPETRLAVEYNGLPAAAPGESVQVTVRVEGRAPEGARLTVEGPAGWVVVPHETTVGPTRRSVPVTLHAPAAPDEWPMRNLFAVHLEADPPLEYTFGVAGAGLYKFLGVYYDALPEEGNQKQMRRRFNQHYVSLAREYLPEPGADVEELYRAWSRKLGRPAIVASYEHEIDPGQLIGLRGPYCCYLARTVLSSQEREVYVVIGNNDAFRLYLNGERVAEEDEALWWAPFNNAYRLTLRQGANHLLLKLLKRGEALHFTLGFRAATDKWRPSHNCEDWLVDLSEVV
jgi:hypothetical protein